MIIKRKKVTKLIDNGDGLSHEESFEKKAPGYNSSGYSYSSSSTKVFTEAGGEEQEPGNKTLMRGLGAAGAGAGLGYAIKTGYNNRVKIKTAEDIAKIAQEQQEKLDNRSWIKKKLGIGERKIGKESAQILQEKGNIVKGHSSARGAAIGGAIIGGLGYGVKKYLDNKNKQG